MMKVYDLNSTSVKTPSEFTLSIGVFDGIHQGHQKILKKLTTFVPNGVLTFYKHPRHGVKLIQPFCERLRDFKVLGINKAFAVTKKDNLLALSAEDFVIKVIKPLDVKRVIVGSDFKLGHNRGTDVDGFKKICEKHNIIVDKIDVVLEEHKRKISSTEIREKILHGDVKDAVKLLGKPFKIKGFVVRGEGLGKKIGFSTANINPHPLKQVVPANGVYRTRTNIKGKQYESMTYVGNNPTLKQGNYYSIETHIPGFNENLHGRVIEVEFLYKTREEIKFNSVAELVEAITKDMNNTKTCITIKHISRY